jgi:F420H(2)-dependent quinone reductase
VFPWFTYNIRSKLRAGTLQDFVSLLNSLKAVVAKHGWKLLGSYATFGEEKAVWWKRADAAYSDFPAYRARAGREIRVLVLEPLAA